MLSGLFHDDALCAGQLAHTTRGILDYVVGTAKSLFEAPYRTDGWYGALRVGYLSFAANLPDVARRMFERVAPTLVSLGPKDQCITLLKELTFGPGIAIYPGRYEKIRPVIEARFGVDLPDFSAELRAWKKDGGEAVNRFSDPRTLQLALLKLGYDLGPAGADGKVGPKTRRAVQDFQRKHHLEDDGLVGRLTSAKLAEALDAVA